MVGFRRRCARICTDDDDGVSLVLGLGAAAVAARPGLVVANCQGLRMKLSVRLDITRLNGHQSRRLEVKSKVVAEVEIFEKSKL